MRSMTGVIDLHLHTGPDHRGRWLDDVEAVRRAERLGMAAILLKTHWTTTADRAIAAARAGGASQVEVYGGVALNDAVGGLNPAAAEKTLALGGREIWMPTHDAAHHRLTHGQQGGIRITVEGRPGALREEVEEVVALVRDHGAFVGTGHVSAPEIVALARHCQPLRVPVLVQHPEWPTTRLSVAQQREIAALGAIFERCAISTDPGVAGPRAATVETIAAEIAQVGPRTTVLSSDLGFDRGPRPFDGLAQFFDELAAAGVAESDLRLMTHDNPRRLLDGEAPG